MSWMLYTQESGYRVKSLDPSHVRLAEADRLRPGEGCAIEVGGRSVALFNVGGRYFAIDNRCLHRGGPLGDGALNGCIASCPWHGWQWDVCTGLNTNNPALRVTRFPVLVEDGSIFADLRGVMTPQEDGEVP